MKATKPIVWREAEWITHKDDLVTLRPVRPHGRLDAYLETILTKRTHYFNQPKTMQTWLAANARAEKAAKITTSIFLGVLVPAVLIIPIYVLSQIGQHIGPGLGVLVVSALSFIVILAIGTTAKSHEIWSVTAG